MQMSAERAFQEKAILKTKGHKGGRNVWCIQAIAERGVLLMWDGKGREVG